MSMGRLVGVLAVWSFAALGGCGSGGTVLSDGGSVAGDRVLISPGGSLGIARVLAGSSIPLSAVLVQGPQNAVLSANRFIWGAAVVNGAQYSSGSQGQTKPCGAVTATTGGVAAPYAPDYTLYVTIDPTNESNVILTPPTSVPPPAGGTASAVYPYCVRVTATVVAGAASGSLIVAVVDPQNPLQ
ncbi:MAG TPA: hypothetical protein VFB22_12940 [Candidatus Baltobacteraceae bacterium]|nr:hypothetical protein [Candidatus Baltobacteraceae bacterium]